MDRAAFVLYRFIALIVGALPLRTGWYLGHFFGTIAYFIGVPYRRLALHNLAIAFPEKTKEERRAIARRHFQLLGANLFSSLKLPRLSREEIESCVRVEGLEHMDEQLAHKGGFVFVISHIGNWEMFAQLTPYAFKCKVGTIYQALGNRFIDAEVRESRARLGLELFERKEGFSAANKFIREGGAVGVLIDQHAGDAGLWCPFFGRLASTSTLAATLALRTEGWLIPAAVYSDGPGRWRCSILGRVKPDGEDAAAITARLNQTLERQIRKQPEDWFWVHNRWKTPRPKFLLSSYRRGVELPAGWTAERLSPFRIVVRSSNWLGDAVMSMHAVQAIKRGRPDAHVTILTPGKLADYWRSVAAVDEVICIEPGESVFDVARKLRGRFEVAIVLPNSLRTALEPWLAKIPRRVGYPGHRRAWLLNQVLRPKKSKKVKAQPPKHHAEQYLDLAEFVGATRGNQKGTTPRIESGGKLRIGVCPGAEYGPAKRWLPERFAEVMQTIRERTGCEWAVFGVEKDRPIADEIIRQSGGECLDLVGKTTLAELIEELRRCALLLTNDTGTMHLAASLGVPVVAIFGSTEPALTGPVGRGHIVVRHHVECSPCFLRECPLDFRCMKRVTAGEVISAIESQLSSPRGSSRPPV
jgi:heptosyltransferase-2